MKPTIRKFPLSSVAVAVALAATTSITAQAEETTTTQEKMVVVASQTPKAISEIPGTVWYIDSEAIQQEYRAGKNLDEILAATVPSLDIASGGRTNAGQNLRGRGITVMIDGVSLQSIRDISRQLDAIDPFNIERIEVLSGASSIYGAGAAGGVINIITKKADSNEVAFETYVSGTSGFNGSEDGDFKIAQSISGGNEKVSGRAAVAYTTTQAFYDSNGDMVTPDMSQGSYQFNDTIDLLGTLQFNISDEQRLNLLAQYYDSQQDSPYGLYFEKNEDGFYDFVDVRDGYHSDRQQGTERMMLSAAYSHDNVLNQQFIAELSYRTEDHTYTPYIGIYSNGEPYKDELSLSSSRQKTEIISAKALLHKSFDSVNLTYGVDGYIDKFTSDQAIYDSQTSSESGGLINNISHYDGRYPGIDSSALAGFIQAEYAITEALSLQGGYRYQYINTEVKDFQKNADSDFYEGGDVDYSVNLFNLGAIYKLTSNSQTWVNFSQGYDLANPAKYYGKNDSNGNPVDVNSSKLDGIKTNSYELGYRIEGADVSFQTAAYYSYSDGSILYDYDNDHTISDVAEPTRVYGLEALVDYWATDRLSLGASGHYVVSEIEADDGWKEMNAEDASTSKANLWVGWTETDYNVKLQSSTAFDYEDADGDSLNGYTVVDLMSTYHLPVGSLGFSIRNLFNEEYDTMLSQRAKYWYGDNAMFDYNGRGRTFTLNYQVKY
ncbi:TonB-dependent receptor [Vibrio paucivorans]|uniref:TonB-dependent receptor n=1 Tax=Vibrio paucivorans TaxID=2829489 RepID=A0A9X3CGD9_9VIBR|nr:TonB-dependent receptor [Vibrio paucivorans]MCW8335236.1 TonB-dependent receptor [Vibrio paucivorans]